MHAVALTSGQLVWLALTYALVGAVGVFAGALLMGRPKAQKAPSFDVHALHDEMHALRHELALLKNAMPPPAESGRAQPVESAYSQAIRLAQQGLDSAAVAAGCGISRGEADLIVAIYRASQRP